MPNREYVCLAVPHIELDTGLIHTDYLPREEVVRCRECVYAEDGGKLCRHFMTSDVFERPCPSEVRPDGFCAWGERRRAD